MDLSFWHLTIKLTTIKHIRCIIKNICEVYSAINSNFDHTKYKMESIDSTEIEIDPPDQIDLPPDIDMDTNNQNDLLLVPDEIDYPQ